MKTYDLYGLTNGSLEDVRSNVEKALPVKFEPHESSFIGDYFLADMANDENIQIRKNIDPIDGEPAEGQYPEASILIYVNGTERADEVAQKLDSQMPEIKHLRRRKA